MPKRVTMPDDHQLCCLDLGCGTSPLPNFVGVDRFPLAGVCVVADLDRLPLPFADSCADAIYACHSLEHVDDLLGVMEEIWRIGKSGARVVIVAPYGAQGLNLANPYHKQYFNEHSPRFWTSEFEGNVPPVEYHHPPHGTSWGLSLSDHGRAKLDLRCQRIEFLHFDEYRNLSPAKQRYLRRRHHDVCDQIIYELVVHKSNAGGGAAESVEIRFPPWLEARRGALQRPWRGRTGRWWRALRTRLHP